ncbi:hypothetical protein [Vulgatibacter incomptus]|uniref:Outer membrane protein n=1 Tax=Vulgatibacter incomptus TaxID=1391653 RepID=A0A0K1PDY9_9BACT|nr:hypothetical protein [Vulgatibacter incomptus]AKU91641.1 hypothetical protein AKJ08_2028 [Vulgatibacter incomptus]
MRLAALIGVLVLTFAQASAAASDHLAVGVGPSHLQLRDELLRPFRWDGFGAALRFGYERRGEDVRHEADLKLPIAFVSNRYGAGGADLDLRLRYDLRFSIDGLGEAGLLLVGARAQWNQAMQVYYDWDEEHLYWMNAYELGPSAAYEWQASPAHRLSASLALPVVALASRPELRRYNKIDDFENVGFYFAAPNRGLRLTSLHEYVSLEAAIAWSWRISDGTRLDLAYELAYRRYARPEVFESLGSTLATSLSWEL